MFLQIVLQHAHVVYLHVYIYTVTGDFFIRVQAAFDGSVSQLITVHCGEKLQKNVVSVHDENDILKISPLS